MYSAAFYHAVYIWKIDISLPYSGHTESSGCLVVGLSVVGLSLVWWCYYQWRGGGTISVQEDQEHYTDVIPAH